MKHLRALFRLFLFIFSVVVIVFRVLIHSRFRPSDAAGRLRMRREWARNALSFLGVRIEQSGIAPDMPCLLMANHRSYLDPILILRDVLAIPVSKAEVEKWPLIGSGARLTGILYLQRESLQSRRQTMTAISERLKEGYPIILFPEGTTHGTPLTGPFRRGGFQLAATQGIPVVPVAMAFGSKEDFWIGDDQFLSHFWRRFGEKEIRVRLEYGPPQLGEVPEALQEATRSWIDERLAAWEQEGWN